MTTTEPQDRQQKADKKAYTFKASVPAPTPEDPTATVEKKFKLPYANEETASQIPGEITYQAIMNPDDVGAQIRLAFATLEQLGVPDATTKALRSLNTNDMLTVVGEWMGESSGFSD